jgi:hypothetical protein
MIKDIILYNKSARIDGDDNDNNKFINTVY